MGDYPPVMTGIHACLSDELKEAGQLGEGPSFDMGIMNSRFSIEELAAIKRGYDLLVEDEAEEIEGEGDELAFLNEVALIGLHGMAKCKPLTCLISRNC